MSEAFAKKTKCIMKNFNKKEKITMNKDIEQVVEEQEVACGTNYRSGLRKGVVVVAVVAAVGLAGYLIRKFVAKPIAKKIKTRKELKNSEKKDSKPVETNFDLFPDEDDDDDPNIGQIFEEDEQK